LGVVDDEPAVPRLEIFARHPGRAVGGATRLKDRKPELPEAGSPRKAKERESWKCDAVACSVAAMIRRG